MYNASTMKLDLRKIYKFDAVELAAEEALPAGAGFYYECAECTHVVSSVPFIATACECGNISGNSGKVTIRDAAKIKPLRGKLR